MRAKLSSLMIVCLGIGLMASGCADAPEAGDGVAVTESALITYPPGTICPASVTGYACAPYPNRIGMCWDSTTIEKVVGCKRPQPGPPVGYYRTCVASCN